MALPATINVGDIANDGSGDDLREAFIKVNQNFQELDSRVTEITVTNLGSSGAGIFKQKVGSELQFKKIQGTGNITVDGTNENFIEIRSSAAQWIIRDDNDNNIILEGGSVTEFEGIGATRITTDNASSPKKIIFTSLLTNETSPALSANLDANNNNIINVNQLNNTPVENIENVFRFDFGAIGTSVTSIIEYIILTTDVDFGTGMADTGVDVDFGADFVEAI